MSDETGQVFHISKERYNRICSQGWKLPSVQTAFLANPLQNVYHFLEDDEGECSICKKTVQGLIANSPAELEMAKMADNAIRDVDVEPSSTAREIVRVFFELEHLGIFDSEISEKSQLEIEKRIERTLRTAAETAGAANQEPRG